MCPKDRYLHLICPDLLPGKTPNWFAYTMNPNWFHQEDLLRSFYREQDLQADCQIMGLMMSVSRSRRLPSSVLRRVGGMDKKTQPEPTDADVVFGRCDKTTPEPHCGWGRSRIEWLWQLERQQKLHQAWLEPLGTLDLSTTKSRSRTSTDSSGKTRIRNRNKACCWSWLRQSCGLGFDSDTDSLDVPYCRRETSS